MGRGQGEGSGTTPRGAGFRQPAEWAPHAACWVAWPWDGSLWLENLAPAQRAFTAMCAGIAESERVEVLVGGDEEGARAALGGIAGVRLHPAPYGDIWLRDTAPIFVTNDRGEVASVSFAFNGWGGKYVLEGDAEVSGRIAEASGHPRFAFPWVLEGGSVEVDGEGTCLTTRQCLLNPNRNPSMDAAAIEAGLSEALGVRHVVWVDEGLLNDHTDGHIDTIARFVRPGVVVCMEARDPSDPNREVLDAIARRLGESRDASGRALEVVRIPSPGRVEDPEGRVMAASFVNFYIANGAVLVPTYGTPWDAEAVERIGALFPGRRAIAVEARSILSGGGALHCITQQEPGAVAASERT